MNSMLYELNFNDILHATKEIRIKKDRNFEYDYNGFCIDCEEKKLVDKENGVIRKISHGTSLSDYEAVLGVRHGATIGLKAMFVFQDPNSDDSFSEELEYKGCIKHVPSKTFYWHPSVDNWNVKSDIIMKNPYGPYITYLTNKFGFKDIYITNAVKCFYGNKDRKKCAENCIRKYLFKEAMLFQPDLVIAFSDEVTKLIDYKEIPGLLVSLYHPAFMVNRPQTIGKTALEILNDNDQRIEEKIRLTTAST